VASYAKPARQNVENIKAKQCKSVLRLAADARPHAAKSRKPGPFAGLLRKAENLARHSRSQTPERDRKTVVGRVFTAELQKSRVFGRQL
jgi:hypothetical protein